MTHNHHDMTAEEYHARPEVSNSMLNHLRKSPAHLRHYLDNPPSPTPAMIVGTATHSAVLEPDLFSAEWGRLPELDFRTKAGKEAKAELAEKYSPDRILKADTYDNVIAIRDAVLAHPLASELLEGASTEVSRFWTHPSGVECKARVDAVPTGDYSRYLVDLKTTQDAGKAFNRSVHSFGYYRGASHYLSSFETSEFMEMDSEFSDMRITEERDRFIFIAVESSPPHGVAVYELDYDAIELGQEEIDILLTQYAQCEAEDSWPSYPTELLELSLPGYAYTQRP